MKTGCGNLSCPGERGHWNASRWGYLLTNLRVSSFTFGLNRLVLAAYHGPYSRAGAVGTVVKAARPGGAHRATSREAEAGPGRLAGAGGPPQGSVLTVGAAGRGQSGLVGAGRGRSGPGGQGLWSVGRGADAGREHSA